jgi:hypothetical protein
MTIHLANEMWKPLLRVKSRLTFQMQKNFFEWRFILRTKCENFICWRRADWRSKCKKTFLNCITVYLAKNENFFVQMQMSCLKITFYKLGFDLMCSLVYKSNGAKDGSQWIICSCSN